MNDAAIRTAHDSDRLADVRLALSTYRERPAAGPGDGCFAALGDLKRHAVEVGEEDLANACWCLEQVGKAQASYVAGFAQGKATDYYGFWCALEQVEITLHSLRSHFPFDGPIDLGLAFLDEYVPRFQSLFPYKLFLSPGMVVHSEECSICGQPLGVRKGCGHEVGMIYNGEECVRIVRDAELLETSFVTNPVQKYSVPFSEDIRYEYGPVRYLLRGLTSPWQGWDVTVSEIQGPGPRFPGTGRNDLCPCGSGRKYKRCCMNEAPKKHHYDFAFEHGPAADLPRYLDDGSFNVAGPPPGF